MQNGFKIICLSAAVLGGAGCVDLPVQNQPRPDTAAVRLESVRLNPGAQEKESLHFIVRAYDRDVAERYSNLSERLYDKIMNETGLYSFVPQNPYEIIICSGKEEYRQKTGAPDWSGGMTVGNAIVIFEYPGADGILAHEMTHLVFNEYMGKSRRDLVWLNEGLAVYIQKSYTGLSDAQVPPDSVRPGLMSFTQMMNFAPLDSKESLVGGWYWEVGDVVGFMLSRGGRLAFSSFLGGIKDGLTAENSLSRAYPTGWQSMDELEKQWKAALK